MKSITLFSVAVALIAFTREAVGFGFTREEKLSDAVWAQWTVNDRPDLDPHQITFKIRAKTLGWVGIGISNTPSMTNADIVIGGLDGTTQYMTDYHGVIDAPVEDAIQSWVLVDITEKKDEGMTTFTVNRPLDTFDEQDIKVENKEIYLIWAIGATDDVKTKHTASGALKVNLLYNPNAPPATERPTTEGVTSVSTEFVTKPDLVGFTREETLSEEVWAQWTVNGRADQDPFQITFKVVAKTLGWVGIGISRTPRMINADLVIGGLDGTNEYMKDYHSGSNDPPVEDALQSWVLLDAAEDKDAGTTTLTVSRPWDTVDEQDIKIEDKEIYLIWAIGATDDVKTKHTARGALKVNLLYNPNTTDGPTTEGPTTEGATSVSTDGVTTPDSESRSTTDGSSALSTVSLTLAIAAILAKFF